VSSARAGRAPRVFVVTVTATLLAVGCNSVLGIPEVGHRADEDAGGEAPVACPPGQISCNDVCVSVLDPSTGCGDPSCKPCALGHAKVACVEGACAIEACEDGFGNCNGAREDGCEATLRDDPKNCGTCGLACAPGFACTASVCACTTEDSCGFHGLCERGICECEDTTCAQGAACVDYDECTF
jgi:hypothetical protein